MCPIVQSLLFNLVSPFLLSVKRFKVMELNKSILLLLIFSPSLLLFAEAICIPRNASNDDSHGPPGMILHVASSAFMQSLPPVSSPSQSPVSYPSLPDYPPHSPSVLPSPFNNAALKKICGVTDHQAECLAIFGPSLTGAIEPLSVLKMGIQTLHKGYEQATAMATKLSNDPSTDGVVKDCLSVCLEVFDLGMTDLDQALTAISSNDMDSLVQLLNGVIGYAETCKDAFTEQGEIASPLAEINDRLDKLGSISISISILVPGVTII